MANGKSHTKKPNILVIFGDDIGLTNLSAYSQGMMGKGRFAFSPWCGGPARSRPGRCRTRS